MKISGFILCLVVLLLSTSRLGVAQNTLVIQKSVVISRSLSGYVNLGLEKVSGESDKVAGKGVMVELRSPDWKTVLASTKTDDNGYFSFQAHPGKLHYLQFSSPGLNPLQVKVRVSKRATHDLVIHMNVAT